MKALQGGAPAKGAPPIVAAPPPVSPGMRHGTGDADACTFLILFAIDYSDYRLSDSNERNNTAWHLDP